ncbi:hypothetical protein GVAV_002420 [Gurleya vavrai]
MARDLRKECLRFINEAVDKCLQHTERKDQNRAFAAISTKLPIRPIKMTLTTAVFLYKDEFKTYVIKRVIVNDISPTQEEEISLALNHPNVIRTFGSDREVFVNTQGEKQNIIWLFSEFLREKVSQRTVNGDENIIRNIMKDVLTALKFLHDEKNMVHLDLKIANVMAQKEKGVLVYKLIDFGYARDFNKEKIVNDEVYIKNKSYGTFPYKPYEVVRKNIHGKPSDIWCTGAIAWFLSLEETPFYLEKGDKDVKEFRKFIDGTKKHFFIHGTSSELKDFILKCMNRNREERPTAAKLLEHPFITGKKLDKPLENYETDDSDYESMESTETTEGYI